MNKRDVGGVAMVAAAWLAAIAAIDPRGEFPLHDDWVYDVSTWTFVHTGRFQFPSVSVVSLRAQVLWGALLLVLTATDLWIFASGFHFEAPADALTPKSPVLSLLASQPKK